MGNILWEILWENTKAFTDNRPNGQTAFQGKMNREKQIRRTQPLGASNGSRRGSLICLTAITQCVKMRRSELMQLNK